MWSRAAALAALLALASCRAQPSEPQFPQAHREVAPVVDDAFSTEDARDRLGEAEEVMDLAGTKRGMSVADVGAGEGYYTVRLARLVGPKGRVLAEDIMPGIRDELSDRVQRERLDNVAVKLGEPNDPKLPEVSFDRVFLIHMYHEIQRPSEFLWHVRGSLKRDGRVIVVDADRTTDRHGTPPKLLVCEFAAIGYELTRFERLSDNETYFAQFEARGPRPEPSQIPTCPA